MLVYVVFAVLLLFFVLLFPQWPETIDCHIKNHGSTSTSMLMNNHPMRLEIHLARMKVKMVLFFPFYDTNVF